MQTNVPKELIDKQELQRLQNSFCKVTGVCVYCQDANGHRVTECTGNQEQQEKLRAYEESGQVQYVCRAGNFRKKGLPYKGALKALKVLMGYGYL